MVINFLKRFSKNLGNFFRKTERFIKVKRHKVKLAIKNYFKFTFPKAKVKSLTEYIINVIFTGLIIQFIVEGKLTFGSFRYGVATSAIMYYIKWFIQTVKQNYEKETK